MNGILLNKNWIKIKNSILPHPFEICTKLIHGIITEIIKKYIKPLLPIIQKPKVKFLQFLEKKFFLL